MAEMSKLQVPETEGKGGDIESGASGTAGGALYPKMTEDPRLRWAFIRRVYSILAVQFLFTSGVAAAIAFIRPIPHFLLSNTPASRVAYFGLLLSPLLVLWPMLHYRERHPVNLFWLTLFTLCISLTLGVVSATVGGRALLQAVILTATILVALTIYTFWAVGRGHDFGFLYPFLFSCVMVLLVFIIIQLFFPLTKIAMAIYGCVASIVFCAFIVYDTNDLIKCYTYDQYICAAISVYLDVINLFISLLTFSAAVE